MESFYDTYTKSDALARTEEQTGHSLLEVDLHRLPGKSITDDYLDNQDFEGYNIDKRIEMIVTLGDKHLGIMEHYKIYLGDSRISGIGKFVFITDYSKSPLSRGTPE